MKIFKFFLLLLALASVTAIACKKKPNPGFSTFQADKSFEMSFGSAAALENDDLKLTFSAIPEDSRCPKGVNCIREGDVKITLVALCEGEEKQLTYTRAASQTGNVSMSFKNFKIHLMDVQPYPEKDKQIQKNDYKIKLVVRKS